MYSFEKKNSKIFSPEGPRENVWGPRENVSPGPAVALDGPVSNAVYRGLGNWSKKPKLFKNLKNLKGPIFKFLKVFTRENSYCFSPS